MRGKRLSALLLGSVLAVSVIAPAAAQQRGPSGADGTYNCADFDTQEEAQAFYESQGGPAEDPHGLDGDSDGIACETLSSGGAPVGDLDDETVEEIEELAEEIEEQLDDETIAELEDAVEDALADGEEVPAPNGVQAGTGGLAASGVPSLVIVLMVVGLLMVAAGGVATRRR